MKFTFEIELKCEVIEGDNYVWYGYEFTPGFIYDNKIYNSIWAHRDNTKNLLDFSKLKLALDIHDEDDEIYTQHYPNGFVYFEDIKDTELKEKLRELMVKAYADSFI